MIILYEFDPLAHEEFLYYGLDRAIATVKLEYPSFTVIPSPFVTPSKSLEWVLSGWLTQVLTLTIGTILIIFSAFREVSYEIPHCR